MSEFDLLRHIAIGQYLPRESVLHRLDPRVKLASVLLLLLAMMFRSNPLSMLLGFSIVLLLLRLAQIPLAHSLRGLRPLLPFFVVVLLIQLLFYPHRQAIAAGSLALVEWGPVAISGAGIVALIGILLQMATIVLLLTLLTAIEDTTGMVHGVQGLLQPLQRLGLPAHEISLVLVIALRFVPLLGRELERLMKAQASRGADFGRGRGGVVQRVRRLFPLFIPLFIAALRRAEELAVAMEARGYVGGRGRTSLVQLRMHRSDWVAMLAAVALAIGFVALDLKPAGTALAGWFRGMLR